MSNDELPPHIRPLAFAAGELFLDMLHYTRQLFDVDIESALILLCVNDATMRPMLQDKALASVRVPQPPDEIRGSISRLMVADKTGLARETVRRKAQQLVAAGYLVVDSNDRLRTTSMLAAPNVQRQLEGVHRAVLRYLERLRELGLDPLDPFNKP